MTPESETLFAVVQFDGAGRHTVRRVVAPFPDRSAAATFALDNDLQHFTVGPMALAVPTRVPFGPHSTRPATGGRNAGWPGSGDSPDPGHPVTPETGL